MESLTIFIAVQSFACTGTLCKFHHSEQSNHTREEECDVVTSPAAPGSIMQSVCRTRTERGTAPVEEQYLPYRDVVCREARRGHDPIDVRGTPNISTSSRSRSR